MQRFTAACTSFDPGWRIAASILAAIQTPNATARYGKYIGVLPAGRCIGNVITSAKAARITSEARISCRELLRPSSVRANQVTADDIEAP